MLQLHKVLRSYSHFITFPWAWSLHSLINNKQNSERQRHSSGKRRRLSLRVRTVPRMRHAECGSNETADFRPDYFPGFGKLISNAQLLHRTTCADQIVPPANEEKHFPLSHLLCFFKKPGGKTIPTGVSGESPLTSAGKVSLCSKFNTLKTD